MILNNIRVLNKISSGESFNRWMGGVCTVQYVQVDTYFGAVTNNIQIK